MEILDLSIIIPTFNEEKNIDNLLQDIENQQYVRPKEIIIADAGSNDKTKEIINNHKTKLIKGGLPQEGRNNGVKAANSEILLFLDADARIPKNFLYRTYNEFQERRLDIACVDNIPISNKKRDFFIYFLHNNFIRLLSKIRAHMNAACFYSRKNIYHKSYGFDKTIKAFDDSEFAKRYSKFCNFDVLDSSYVYVSVRRFEKEGRLKTVAKVVSANLYRFFTGKEIRSSKFKYEFGNYD